jgi:diadenylate cyclase
VAVVVSEETGTISVAHNGRMIQRLDAARLRHILAAFYRPRGGSRLAGGFARLWGRRGPAEGGSRKSNETVGD